MRSAFSLVSTIFFVVLLGTLGVSALLLSTISTKQTSDIYLKEQAEILAKSGTEMAIFSLLTQKEPFSQNCPKGKTFIYNFPNEQNPILEISVVVVEIFGDFDGCGKKIATKESYGTVILDTFVKSAKTLNEQNKLPNNEQSPKFPLTFHKRTIQKL